ncbi:MAG: tetratricopeptide repeat protein, partial [Bdellovibrionia bacterium]
MRLVKACFVIAMLSMSGQASAQWVPWESLQKNREAVKSFEAKDYKQGLNLSGQGLQEDAFRFEHHMNLALNLEALGEAEAALKAYENALQFAQTPEQKFQAHFNLGHIYGKAKKIPEAVAQYQAALDLNPTSVEAKHNIELLTQMSQQGQGGQEQNQQQQQSGGKGQDQQQEQKDQNEDKKDEKEKEEPQEYQQNQKYKPRNFEGKELSEADVKQILNELKQQE